MASPITFSGLASGLDTQSIIQTLVALESRPITALQTQKTNYNKQSSLYSTLDTRLQALQTAAENLKSATDFKQFAADVVDSSVLRVSASGTAQEGAYSLDLTQLAQQTRLASQGYANTDTLKVGDGTLSIDVGGTVTEITIDGTNDTLEGVAAAIKDSQADVTAEIVNVGGANPYKLVISGKNTGFDNAVTVDASGLTGGDQALAVGEIQPAQNAIFSLNGLTGIERSTNSVDDVISGVTLDLLSKGSSDFTVSVDKSGITQLAKDFIKAYNDVIKFVNDQSRYDTQNPGNTSPLLGDFTLSSLQSRLRSTISTSFDGVGTYTSLSIVGFKTQNDGTLTLDETKFGDALDADLEGVSSLFTSSSGFGKTVYDLLDALNDPVDGIVKTRKDSIQSRITSLDDQIARAQQRIDQFEKNLTDRFASLEGLVSQLQTQGQSLSSFFSTASA